MEISENGYQGEERKVSPFRKFLGVLANIFTFGIYIFHIVELDHFQIEQR